MIIVLWSRTLERVSGPGVLRQLWVDTVCVPERLLLGRWFLIYFKESSPVGGSWVCDDWRVTPRVLFSLHAIPDEPPPPHFGNHGIGVLAEVKMTVLSYHLQLTNFTRHSMDLMKIYSSNMSMFLRPLTLILLKRDHWHYNLRNLPQSLAYLLGNYLYYCRATFVTIEIWQAKFQDW